MKTTLVLFLSFLLSVVISCNDSGSQFGAPPQSQTTRLPLE
jgi:hypothetical protein